MNHDIRKEHWSNKYKARENILMDPEPFIVNNTNYLIKGSILDIACGDGRNAIYLAKQGFNVTGVDFTPEALKRLIRFSKINHVSVRTKELDLDDIDLLIKIGKFDNIIINHYKPSDETFNVLPNLLKKKGILIICTFNYLQSIEKGFKREFCLEKNELVNKWDNLKLIKHENWKNENTYLDGYIFEKI
ncbi:tellurite methyltransferase TehB [Gottschalkia purinilytica]|uniref:Tellurite methyltransferase TehB n=1 Tax=Gottschalkia purinilytica TaxID=1503 RepID=A0A0L0WDF6_GOTPU|nr:methyltransferase domain-containing protein [Gottschalkia purinilytica]KNF09455.1 tellurite methyltransferase TehB [Gottschalkia purinilytica]